MYFCLNCIHSKEEETRVRITNLLERTVDEEFLVWFPKKEVKEKRQGKYETVSRPMFSNYLFIFWDGEMEMDFPFLDIARMPTVVRILRYDDGTHALKGKDLSFAKWIHMNDGFIKQSKVIVREGQKIHICDGPLKGFDGNVIKVDKHHKRIVLRFELGGTFTDVNFSADFLYSGSVSNGQERTQI